MGLLFIGVHIIIQPSGDIKHKLHGEIKAFLGLVMLILIQHN